jgi:Gram-negative bacterial TonB protein C-terminal
MDSTRSRMALALGASALLHAWAMHDTRGLGVPRVRVDADSSAPLTATLREPAYDVSAPDIASTTPVRIDAMASPVARDPAVVTPKARAAPVEASTAAVVAVVANGNAPLPQPSDPTYYGALSLDVYPKAMTAIDLNRAIKSAAAGPVRATVLIDEAGVVNEVRAIQAASPDMESAARTLLLQTRFTPARKDGRVVKAEVRVSLGYGTPSP